VEATAQTDRPIGNLFFMSRQGPQYQFVLRGSTVVHKGYYQVIWTGNDATLGKLELLGEERKQRNIYFRVQPGGYRFTFSRTPFVPDDKPRFVMEESVRVEGRMAGEYLLIPNPMNWKDGPAMLKFTPDEWRASGVTARNRLVTGKFSIERAPTQGGVREDVVLPKPLPRAHIQLTDNVLRLTALVTGAAADYQRGTFEQLVGSTFKADVQPAALATLAFEWDGAYAGDARYTLTTPNWPDAEKGAAQLRLAFDRGPQLNPRWVLTLRPDSGQPPREFTIELSPLKIGLTGTGARFTMTRPRTNGEQLIAHWKSAPGNAGTVTELDLIGGPTRGYAWFNGKPGGRYDVISSPAGDEIDLRDVWGTMVGRFRFSFDNNTLVLTPDAGAVSRLLPEALLPPPAPMPIVGPNQPAAPVEPPGNGDNIKDR
jgi:hypothetical protein